MARARVPRRRRSRGHARDGRGVAIAPRGRRPAPRGRGSAAPRHRGAREPPHRRGLHGARRRRTDRALRDLERLRPVPRGGAPAGGSGPLQGLPADPPRSRREGSEVPARLPIERVERPRSIEDDVIELFLPPGTSIDAPGLTALRAAMAALTGFLVVIASGRWFVPFVAACRFHDAAEKGDSEKLDRIHAHKRSTPTLGGVLIVAGTAAAALAWTRPG